MDINLLKELYLTPSPSGKEEGVRKIVTRELDELRIPYRIDKEGNVYRLIENSVLVCSHMDQVNQKFTTRLTVLDDFIYGDGNLGADDKNGIFIIINLLKNFRNLSFIFSTKEETGGNLRSLLKENENILESIKYGLIFDRAHKGDIIGEFNEYCTQEFEDDLAFLGRDFGYKPDSGIFSDADNISDYISCVNLSVGYYDAHTDKEFTVLSHLFNAFSFGKKIINSIDSKYEKPEKTFIWNRFNNVSYGHNYYPIEVDVDDIEEGDYYFCSRCIDYYEEDYVWENDKGIPSCVICDSPLEIITSDLFEDHYKEHFDYIYDEYEGMLYCHKCKEYMDEYMLDAHNQKICIDCRSPLEWVAVGSEEYEDDDVIEVTDPSDYEPFEGYNRLLDRFNERK